MPPQALSARTAVEAHLTDRLAKAFEQLVSERVETKLAGPATVPRDTLGRTTEIDG